MGRAVLPGAPEALRGERPRGEDPYDAEKEGAGAAVFNGKLIDIASIKQAKVLIDQHEKIFGKLT